MQGKLHRQGIKIQNAAAAAAAAVREPRHVARVGRKCRQGRLVLIVVVVSCDLCYFFRCMVGILLGEFLLCRTRTKRPN